MIGLGLLFPAALAAPADFPLRAPVSCPAEGVCRILVPPAMSASGSALLLTNANGRLIPSARLPHTAAPDRWEAVQIEASDELRVLDLDVKPPVSVLRIVPASGASPMLTLRTRGEVDEPWSLGVPTRLREGTLLSMPDPDARHVSISGARRTEIARIEAGHISAVREVSAVAADQGERLVLVTLSEPATIRRLTLEGAADGHAQVYDWASEGGQLQPRFLGEHPITDGTIAGLAVTGRRLMVALSEPAQITAARAWAPREVMLVRDGGSMLLYGGADGDSTVGLQAAATELLALPWAGATVEPAIASPDYLGGEDLLMAPGAPIEPARFRYQRRLSGEGLLRIPLPPEVTLRVRQDLGDVRILDDQDRQVPFVILHELGEAPAGDVTVVTEEQPGRTALDLALPRAGTGSVTVVLSTPARGFSRIVTVRAGSNSSTRHRWEGTRELVLPLTGPLPENISITIENGDDPPIPVSVAASVPKVSLLARLSEPSRLVYSDRSVMAERPGARLGRRKRKRLEPVSSPSYDLQRVGEAVLMGVVGDARLGEPEEILLAGDDSRQQQLVFIASILAALAMLGVLGRLLLDGRSGREGDEGGG
ncbi:MAG: hypothetical protein ACI8S6_004873 [Myxococcota bacterium]